MAEIPHGDTAGSFASKLPPNCSSRTLQFTIRFWIIASHIEIGVYREFPGVCE
jgi:hypothetical protein